MPSAPFDELATIATTFSPDRAYRYEWSIEFRDRPLRRRAVFIMLNPSTADEDGPDPTIRRCMSFALREGCDSLLVLNLYALRSTDPKGLWAVDDPVGMLNDKVIDRSIHRNPGPVIAAWGMNAKADRVARFLELSRSAAASLWCLGTTKSGAPRHPLYVKGDTPLERWP